MTILTFDRFCAVLNLKDLVDGSIDESKDNIIKGQYEKSIAIVKSRRKKTC